MLERIATGITSRIIDESPYPVASIAVIPNSPGSVTEKIITGIKFHLLKLKMGILHKNAFSFLENLMKEQEIGAIHVHYGPSAELFLPFAKKHNLPLIVSFHGYDASVALRSKRLSSFYRQLFSYPGCFVIGVSSKMLMRLESLGLSPVNSRLIRYGIDIDQFKPAEKKPSGEKLIILHSGRLVPKKGIPDLVSAFAASGASNTSELWIAGDGPLESEIKLKITEAGVGSSVKLLGKQTNDQIAGLMKKADIFVLNSRVAPNGDREGVPVSLMEAMASGLAVISTLHEGIPEIIHHGINGILVPEHSTPLLAKAIGNVAGNPELRKNLGAEARLFAEKFLTRDQMITQIKEVYREVLGPNE